MSNLPPHAYVLGIGPGAPYGAPAEVRRPKLWTLHLVYCVLLGLVYVGCLVGAVLYVLYRDAFLGDIPTADVAQLDATVAICGFLSVPLAAAFLSAPFLPRKPWAWTAHLILCCIGLTSACCLPVCIPVLVAWLKPETKAWFGKR